MKNVFVVGKFVIIATLIIMLSWLVVSFNTEKRKVLVVHSYNTDMAWVNEIDWGIQEAIDDSNRKMRDSLNLRTHYMNLRNHPNCNYYKNATYEVRETIDEWQPEILIIVDDLGQALVGFNQLNLKPEADRAAIAEGINSFVAGAVCDPPDDLSYFGIDRPAVDHFPFIVFAGVNDTVDDYGYNDADNVSGIFERKNYMALIETLRDMREGYSGTVNGIMMLNDASATGQRENEAYLRQHWEEFEAHEPVAARTLNEWQNAVRKANDENLMLLIANYSSVDDDQNEDNPNKKVANEALIAWTENEAKLPVLGANTDFVTDGGMITVAISGKEQGRVAMEIAIEKLEGKSVRSFQEAKQFLIGLNQSIAQKRDLKLPQIYESFSKEIGMFIDKMQDRSVFNNGSTSDAPWKKHEGKIQEVRNALNTIYLFAYFDDSIGPLTTRFKVDDRS